VQTADGCHSGHDDCAEGLVCYADSYGWTEGTCHALCTGSPSDPQCPAGSECKGIGDMPLCVVP
jgi:hypothetical protein